MQHKELSAKDYQIYLLKSLLWLGLGWLGFLSTLLGFFYATLIWLVFFVALFWLFRYGKHNSFSFKPSKEAITVGLATGLVVLVFAFFSTPTVFTGRDQGSFAEAAIRLSRNHQLEFSTPASEEFFKIRQQGRSLNYPGFYYTANGNLLTQFSLAYIAWLALFFAPFGVVGLILANAVLLYIFFLSFYLLIRLFLQKWASLPTFLFMTTSFVFMWFSKMTLSENMALPLLWTSILALMMLLKQPKKFSYLVLLLATTLLCFARIEGFAFLAVLIFILVANKNSRQFLLENINRNIILPIGFFFIIFMLNLFNDVYFYKEIAKALLPNISAPKAQYLGTFKNNLLPNFYMEKIFYLYGLLGFFLFGALGILHSFWKKEFYKLIPFFITLPTFIYFINDHISPDHPWLLRRFSFALAPMAIFYSGLLLGQYLSKKTNPKAKFVAIVLTSCLLAGNLPSFAKYLTFAENKNLRQQTAAFSEQFGDNDLLLIDQKTTGDGWSMISGPLDFLYHKNAIYFFNISDLAKIKTDKFANVYLITPDSQAATYLASTFGKKMTLQNKYTFELTKLSTTSATLLDEIVLPDKKTFSAHGQIFKINN